MPKLKISSETRKTGGSVGCEYTLVRLDGFIDAPNFLSFDQKLEELVESGVDRLVLDFRRVQYINSTGITTLIRVHSNLDGRDGCLILVQVPRSVGLTMHLLGVTTFVPFLKGLKDAESFMETKETTPPAEAEFYEAEAAKTESPKEIPVLADAPSSPSGTVVVAVPREGPFTAILRSRLSGLNGRYQLTHSVDEIMKRLDEWDPDLVVLDHRLEGADDFIENLKTNTHASLTSVIMLYQEGTDIGRLGEFRVWENDFLIDPFDLMNLFRLTESELRRVPRDKKLFTQQVRFCFESKRSGVERGLALCNQLLQRLKLSDTENTAIYAALKEAVDNAVLHGNHHDPEKKVEINFLVDPHKLTIMIEDEGEGFEYDYYLSKIDNQEAFEKAKQRIRAGGRGGLGILLMHKCSDRLEYSGHGNAVRIEKNLPR